MQKVSYLAAAQARIGQIGQQKGTPPERAPPKPPQKATHRPQPRRTGAGTGAGAGASTTPNAQRTSNRPGHTPGKSTKTTAAQGATTQPTTGKTPQSQQPHYAPRTPNRRDDRNSPGQQRTAKNQGRPRRRQKAPPRPLSLTTKPTPGSPLGAPPKQSNLEDTPPGANRQGKPETHSHTAAESPALYGRVFAFGGRSSSRALHRCLTLRGHPAHCFIASQKCGAPAKIPWPV